jgi:hypothetical protein
MSEEIFIFEKL